MNSCLLLRETAVSLYRVAGELLEEPRLGLDIRRDVARSVYDRLTLFSSRWTPAHFLGALRAMARWTPTQVWTNSQQAAGLVNERGVDAFRQRLARCLAVMPALAGRTLPLISTVTGPEELRGFIPAIVPLLMPTDTLEGAEGTLEVRELAGFGGCGECHLAVPAGDDEPVIVKLGSNDIGERSLKHEAQMLRHAFDGGVSGLLYPFAELSWLEGRRPFVAFPYMKDGTLADWMRRRGPLSVPEATRIIRQLIDIVAGLHALEPSVVHSDVKPGNVFVRLDDKGRLWDLLLGDLGGALECSTEDPGWGPAPEPPPLPRQKTIDFAPVEQIDGWAPHPSDDVHALCVTWCHLLGVNPIYSMPPRGPGPVWERRLRLGWDADLRARGLPKAHVEMIRRALGWSVRRPSCAELQQVV